MPGLAARTSVVGLDFTDNGGGMPDRKRREKPACLRRLFGCTRGDVLMEYLLVTVFIILPLIGVSTVGFSPGGRSFSVRDTLEGQDFGIIGNAYVEVYRRVMSGIGLPIP